MASQVHQLIGYYDDIERARRAEQELLSVGFDSSQIKLVAQAHAADSQTAVEAKGTGSFWESIKDLFSFSNEEDRYYYNEALRQGRAILTVEAEDARVDEAARILERHQPADLERDIARWQEEGFARFQGQAVKAPDVATPVADESIPVVEEELKVGKRQIRAGGVRIHSRVVETPVEEQVRLRQERVHVERRPVDRPVNDPDRAFQEKTIEATEMAEEAVVEKEARVVEEISVRKEAQERVETVRDSVRRTDVQVEETNDPDHSSREAGKARQRADQELQE